MYLRSRFNIKFFKNFWQKSIEKLVISFFGRRKGRNPVESLHKVPIEPTKTSVSVRNMHLSISHMASVRIPMIKFIGARLPRPHFDRASLPPLQISGNFAAATPAKATSIGPVGKIPRGQGIEPSQLPVKFRRTGLTEEECEAINTGFFYQR